MNNKWWKPVLLFYVKTTSWIVFPLLLAVLAGGYFGQSTGSEILFFVFVMAGFGITCFGIYREVKQYKKDLGINPSMFQPPEEAVKSENE